jgi:hypothetical protein
LSEQAAVGRAVMSQIGAQQLAADANQSAERALDGIRRIAKTIRAMRECQTPGRTTVAAAVGRSDVVT